MRRKGMHTPMYCRKHKKGLWKSYILHNVAATYYGTRKKVLWTFNLFSLFVPSSSFPVILHHHSLITSSFLFVSYITYVTLTDSLSHLQLIASTLFALLFDLLSFLSVASSQHNIADSDIIVYNNNNNNISLRRLVLPLFSFLSLSLCHTNELLHHTHTHIHKTLLIVAPTNHAKCSSLSAKHHSSSLCRFRGCATQATSSVTTTATATTATTTTFPTTASNATNANRFGPSPSPNGSCPR